MESARQTPIVKPADAWDPRPVFRWQTGLVLFAIAAALAVSARRTEMDRAAVLTLEGVAEGLGLRETSDVGTGLAHFFEIAFPLAVSERTEAARIEGLDRNDLPWLAHIVEEPRRTYDTEAGRWVERGTVEYVVEPLGYLWRVLALMLETIEIAAWGAILSVIIALPLAYFASSGYAPNRWLYHLSRALCSFNRAIPELIGAMFLVLMYGFGPVAGVLALGIHTSGFLGKFFADEIENAPKGPQEALLALGANKIKVLRYAVWPQAAPQCLAYIQYILERNVRSATVLGIVGAGGIGMELKGRWDLSDFGHVSTILLVIFATVFVLEHLTQSMRAKIIK